MADNIVRFPGFIDLGDGYRNENKGYQYGCKHYPSFKALVLDLTPTERARTTKWRQSRGFKADRLVCDLKIIRRGGGDAA